MWNPTALLEALDDSVTVFSRDGIFVYANPATERMFGKPRSELIGKNIWVAFPDGVGSDFYRAFCRIQESGASEPVEAYYATTDRWYRNDFAVLGDHIHVITRDISTLKLGERRLLALARASQAFTHAVEVDQMFDEIARALAEHVGDACLVRVVDADRLRLVALHHPDAKRRDKLREFFAKPLALDEGLSARVLATGESMLVEKIEPDRLRSSFHEEAQRGALDRGGGAHSTIAIALCEGPDRIGVITMLRDVTPRAYTQNDLSLLQDLTDRASMALSRARLFEQERVASANKDEFLAMLGHELRNPLAPILTALELMRFRGETGAQREREMIERQTKHLVRLVDDLLDISRITRGKVELRKSRVDIGAAIAQAVEMASPLLEQRGHHVSIAAPRGVVFVDGDSFRLAQIFQNLLTNAAKYTPSGGSIAVRVMQHDNVVVAEVEDNGEGIAPDALEAIFEPFVQGARQLDRAQGGLGIGLTLVRSLTELHGGSVEAHSAGPGQGSRFVVRLPPAADDALADKVLADRIPALGKPRRVLLVDDNRDAAAMLAELLREAGHEVVVAYDGPSALGTVSGFHPDVALLDIGLPLMDGYDLARRLKAVLPSVPRLVAISGYGQGHDRARSREAGFDAHLVKPVQAAQLLAAVDDTPS